MKIALVVAIDKNYGIGKNNDLLTYLPADLKRFKQLTTGHTIVMGRKTFESLPNGALPNRKNIVLTSSKSYQAANCVVVNSVQAALNECNAESNCFIIGGGEIYKLFFPKATHLNITKIHHAFVDVDTFFPEIDPAIWILTSDEIITDDPKASYPYSFVTYERRAV